MITIYSADSAGRLFTDPKKHFFIDADLLRERATILRTRAVLNRIAQILGYDSYESLSTSAVCRGITADVLMKWILSGTIADNMKGV